MAASNRRLRGVLGAALATIALLPSLAGAADDALRNPDWNEHALVKAIDLITKDPKSGSYEKLVWFVVIDGDAYLRTDLTRWLENLRREPNAKVRIKQQIYGVRGEEVAGDEIRKQVEAALKHGYGRLKRFGKIKLKGTPIIVRLEPRS